MSRAGAGACSVAGHKPVAPAPLSPIACGGFQTKMSPAPVADLDGQTPSEISAFPPPKVSLLNLGAALFVIGATTFGGMWGATQKLEDELVRRRRWLTVSEQQALMVAATLIPAPKFLAFGGMVGFRLRGWPGTIVALFSLLTPPSFFVVLGVVFLSPEVMGAPLVPIRRAVGIAVVGLLLGNAFLQMTSSKVTGRKRVIGIGLTVSVAAAAIAGVHLLIAAAAGFVLGALLMRPNEAGSR